MRKKIDYNTITKWLLNTELKTSDITNVFEQLAQYIDFEEAFIVYLNPDSITIKHSFPFNKELIDQNIPLKDEIIKNLFTVNEDFSLQDKELAKILPFKYANSIFISKLTLKNMVYGALIFASSKPRVFTKEVQDFISTISSILAYKIKDKELSEIFAVQLKAIQESYVKSKKDYKTIKEQNVKILEVDKIKSEFLANITHELRTPLNAIIGFSEMLKTKLMGDLNPKQEEYIGDIYISGVHLLGMINEILDISKIESKAMTLNKFVFDISRAIDEVYNVISPLAIKKEITLVKSIQDIPINADLQKIKQILYNIVSNAIKFTSTGGKIEISTTFDKNNLYISVSDNGIGIEPKDQERIFDKFVQLETYTKTGSSTGLGLTITKNFVEAHGGKITVESEPKKGSTFKVKLPLK